MPQLEATFQSLKAASARTPDYARRVANLRSLQRMLQENAGAIAAAIDKDFGNRSRHETQLLELFPALEAVKYARKHLKSWMKPQRSWASLLFMPARVEIRSQPLGVVGIIVPWNYPLYLAIGPLVGALAAGNRAMIKVSEFTPHSGELLAALTAKYFAPDCVSVINGGPDTAKRFAALPFDHLLFTGSTAVGREVMRAAAGNLNPVTLELGGKSPAIVGDDFPIDLAAERILFGKCLNSGQTCIAPDYVMVPREKTDAFVEAARAAVARLYPTLLRNPDYTSIINERHHQRLVKLVEEARSRGAKIIDLAPAAEDLTGSAKLAPTLLTGVDDGMRVMQEEIFGPLLPVISYTTLDDAIRYVNEHARPLALYYFGHEHADIERVLNETIAGGVTLNETILHISQDHLPFGGVGPSGMGSYHGHFGFETFSKQKAVFHQSSVNGLKLFQPPFGKRFEALIKFLLR